MTATQPVTLANETPVSIGIVTLAVRDLPRVSAFYGHVLELQPMQEDADSILLGAGGVGLLRLRHEPNLLPDDPRTAGLFHTAFLMPTRSDLSRWLRRFGELGLHLDGASDHIVSEALYLSDPEGNGIEVYADRPQEAWRRRPDGLDMGTYPLDIDSLLNAGEQSPYRLPPGLRVGHIHLRVGDLDAAEAFYSGMLGFDVMARVPGAAFIASGGYHHHIGLNVWRSKGAGPRDASRAGLAGFELSAMPDALAAARQRLESLGQPHNATDTGLVVADPWGTQVELRRATNSREASEG